MIAKVGNKKKILLVDDDVTVTRMLSMLLETRGFHVEIAHSGKEAFQNGLSSTDLILLDLVLPDQEGFDVCRQLKENQETRHIPIIVLSGKMLSEYKVECLYLGADDYLTKPFDYEELVARMEAVLRRAPMYRGQQLISSGEETLIRDLHKIIDQELIIPFFQPILHLSSGKLLGVESLCRPQISGVLSNPEFLFKVAFDYGVYQDLEMLAWKKALQILVQSSYPGQLFLNCNPYLVEDPKFSAIATLFKESGMDPDHVYLEITERSAISDFKTFYEHLTHFRAQGFKFAVDDVGGGYASLESIVETKPEIVKIDRHIISDIVTDSFKRSIVKFIVSFCKENHILSIAEGIETKKDLEVVRNLGVDAVQGFYLHKPSPEINSQSIQEAINLTL